MNIQHNAHIILNTLISSNLQIYLLKSIMVTSLNIKKLYTLNTDLPKSMKKVAAMMGFGMVTKKAPNLVNTPKAIMNSAETCTTRRLPTYREKEILKNL